MKANQRNNGGDDLYAHELDQSSAVDVPPPPPPDTQQGPVGGYNHDFGDSNYYVRDQYRYIDVLYVYTL
jgi:hypothetical protein